MFVPFVPYSNSRVTNLRAVRVMRGDPLVFDCCCISIIRQIFEKSHEYSTDLHNIFIDYTQSSYSIDKNKVLES
jgi:hypothetical protein